jgi:multiple sugar transport system permease protein
MNTVRSIPHASRRVRRKARLSLKRLFMLLILALVLFPFFWLLISSFKLDRDILTYPPRIFAASYTLVQYQTVIKTIPILRYLLNTVVFAGSVVVCSLFFDSMSGYAFARIRFRGRNALFSAIIVTMMIPMQILLIPLYVQITKMSLLDTYAGLILPRMSTAFGIFMMRSAFVSLPRDLEEAGRIDGVNELGIFFRIMLPLAKPAMITLGIFTLMANWNDLMYPMILTSSATMRTLPSGLAMFAGDRVAAYGLSIAGSVISMAPLLLVYAFAQRFFIAGVAVSGMKE